MNTQPTPERSTVNQNPDMGKDIDCETIDTVQQQHLNLKLEVEHLYRNVDRLSGWLQTLVSGLVIAILIAISISSWLVYRLLIQEQIAQREAQKAAETQAEILERVKQLEEQLQSLDRLAELTDITQINQQELKQLRDRLNEIATKQRQLTTDLSSTRTTVEQLTKPTQKAPDRSNKP